VILSRELELRAIMKDRDRPIGDTTKTTITSKLKSLDKGGLVVNMERGTMMATTNREVKGTGQEGMITMRLSQASQLFISKL